MRRKAVRVAKKVVKRMEKSERPHKQKGALSFIFFASFQVLESAHSQRNSLVCSKTTKNHCIYTSKIYLLILPKLLIQISIMSDKRKMQNKPLIILQNTEDYTDWKFQAISKLQQESCN